MPSKMAIYHKNCSDGRAAALILWRLWKGQGEFVEYQYNDTAPLPDVTGKDVVIVDFSFKREVLLEMKEKAASLVVLDHHKSAQEELKGLDFAYFDMTESGATMAWKYFYPDKPVPLFFQYIRDRDIWLKQLPDTDAFAMGLRLYPMTFEAWDGLTDKVEQLIAEGQTILRYHQQYLEKIAQAESKGGVALIDFEGHRVPLLNQGHLISEVGDMLGAKYPFVLMYFDVHGGKRVYSLRSRGAVDVSAIAKRYGGGGHAGAAGFTTIQPSGEVWRLIFELLNLSAKLPTGLTDPNSFIKLEKGKGELVQAVAELKAGRVEFIEVALEIADCFYYAAKAWHNGLISEIAMFAEMEIALQTTKSLKIEGSGELALQVAIAKYKLRAEPGNLKRHELEKDAARQVLWQ